MTSTTTLHQAVRGDQIKEVIHLLPDVDIEAKDNEGKTALHLAAELGRVCIAEILLKNGANVLAFSKKRVTPLQLAIQKERMGVLEIFARHDQVYSYTFGTQILFYEKQTYNSEIGTYRFALTTVMSGRVDLISDSIPLLESLSQMQGRMGAMSTALLGESYRLRYDPEVSQGPIQKAVTYFASAIDKWNKSDPTTLFALYGLVRSYALWNKEKEVARYGKVALALCQKLGAEWEHSRLLAVAKVK